MERHLQPVDRRADRLAAQLPASQWSALPAADPPQEQYAWVKHQPGARAQVQPFATVRWKKEGDFDWRYAYVACQAREQDRPQAVFERHRLKWAKEQGFSELLSGLDLHHPPCMALVANQAFYAIATLAYNVLISLKVLALPGAAQGWRLQTIIRHLLTMHVSVSTPARYRVAHICIPTGWWRWWRLFVDQ